MLTLFNIPALDRWTPIAQRHRLEGDAKWIDIEGAPLSLARATQLRDEGVLTQALAYRDEFVIVVVRAAAVRGPPQAKLTAALPAVRQRRRSADAVAHLIQPSLQVRRDRPSAG
jgi:hypothetical protein